MRFFIYRILSNLLTVSLRNKIVIVENESQRLRRQAGNVVLVRKTGEKIKNVFYESIKVYNSLPVRIKQCDGLLYCISEIAEKAK